MSIRKAAACATSIVALVASSHLAAQDPAPPTFRSRVDVITVDVVAVDKQGRPVEDLKPGDFAVKVDGRGRPVVSAQLLKVDRTRPAGPAALPDALVSTNVGLQNGRRVVVAVDQTLIVPGSIAPLLRTASRFVDSLPPADYAALLAFPEPGPRVDFTTDKAPVRQAMLGIVGQPAKTRTTTFNLSLTEAQAIDSSEKTFVNILASTVDDVWNSMGPMTRRVMERGCRSLTEAELRTEARADDLRQCLRDLTREAGDMSLDMKTDTRMSLRRLESYLRELAALDGPKSLILISAGIVAEDAALEEIWRLAADARTTINVVAVDRERERDRTDLANGQSEMKLQDRSLEMRTLEAIAERTGGTLYRAIGPAEGVFDRLASELSASYLVAVERRDGDPERQRIEIDVKRRGVTVRSPRTVTTRAAASPGRSSEDVLREALASPLPVAGVPIRLATFARRDPGAGAYLLNLAAQLGQAGESGGYAVAYSVTDQQNRLVASRADRVQATASARAGDLQQYGTTLTLPPGTYSVRLAAVDNEGRRGVVIRSLELPALTGGTLTTSDLIVGTMAGSDAQTLTPGVEPRVDGRVGAYLELYVPESDQGRLTVTLEIAEGEASPALTSAALNLTPGTQAGWRVASGAIDPAMLPGRYIARAAVRRDGVMVRTVSRPFVLARRAGGTPPPPVPARAGPVPFAPEARVRTATYVSSFVRGLANVVGQEDFELSGPDRRVTSDFLLVQHPASPGDFLTYRDVTAVNGSAIADRQERLADLFLTPAGPARDRVRQITQAAEQHVPSLLNPIFVLAFLQADLQSRFELAEDEAGRGWPPGVKAVTFTEVAKPTILRGGIQGERDVPVRGTAWIEPETGRVLQTELIVPAGRSSTTIVTKFMLDPRLQIMVPEQMRTENPKGVATYSNFRRFSVQTDTAVETPPVQ